MAITEAGKTRRPAGIGGLISGQIGSAVGAPASARSKRKALTGQLPYDVRAIEAQFSICDDFLPQFAVANEMGRQFSDAWFAARQVIDLGRRASKPAEPPALPTTPKP